MQATGRHEEGGSIEEEVLLPQLTKDPLLVQTRPLSPSELSLSNFAFYKDEPQGL